MRQVVITQSDDVPTAVVQEPVPLTCLRSQVTISGQGSTAGNGIEYEWNGPGIVGSNTGIDIAAAVAGVYTLTVRNTNNGCEQTGNNTLAEDRVDPAAVANVSEKIDCNTSEVTVSGAGSMEGNVTYQWSIVSDTGNIVGPTDQRDIVADLPGTYELLVTNLDNGCTSTDEAVVEQEGDIIRGFSTEVKHPGCADVADGQIEVSGVDGGVGPYTYSFDDGVTYVSSPVQGQLEPGVYRIIVRDNSGCEVVDSATLNAPFDFFIDLGEDQIVLLGESVTLVAQTNLPDSLRNSIQWSPVFDTLNQSTLMQEFTPSSGQYSIGITVSNNNGCLQKDQVNVFVRFEERVYVPTAMHPGGLATDNNYLNIYADPASVASITQFEVFDRWGTRVFQRGVVPVSLSLQRDYAWDGTCDGQEAAPGVYTYFVELEYVTGYKEVISGGVTLLR